MPANASTVPADAVLGSGSGLDPDISIDNAMMQVPRVAAESGISETTVRELIQKHEQGRFLWIWGEPRVNVLEINVALKDMKEDRSS
jgi:K+-transporting ATPase c subunit